MQKLHYTDPLKAAYMEREFGVLFTDRRGEETIHIYRKLNMSKFSVTCEYLSGCSYGYEGYSYIHPDSLDIFKPKVGDLLVYHRPVSCGGGVYYYEKYIDINHKKRMNQDCVGEIIQRDSRLFFVPESEAARG